MKALIGDALISQCKDCRFHEVHEIVLDDDFDHDFGTYCSQVEDDREGFERHTYSGRINKKMIGGDDWGVSDAEVPDWCPFIINQYEKLFDKIAKSSGWGDMLDTIEANPSGSQKLIPDHGRRHAKVVALAAADFLDELEKYRFEKFCYHEIWCSTKRNGWLAAIAALLHDVGASKDPTSGHTAESVVIAKEMLKTFTDNTGKDEEKVFIVDEDVELILKAIANHSDGGKLIDEAKALFEQGKKATVLPDMPSEIIVPAALLLADKLDVTKKRVGRRYLKTLGEDPEFDAFCEAASKIKKAKFKFTKPGKDKNGDRLPVTGAELHYTVDEGFDFKALKFWPPCILVPKMIAKDILGLKRFSVFVNNQKKNIDFFTSTY